MSAARVELGLDDDRLPLIATIGNPNTGKSTLFNLLTGLRQKVGNYPGVTVERHVGETTLGGRRAQLVDLPGAYSLSAHSPDEMVAVDVLLGRIADLGRPDAVVVVVDASNLRRNLYIASQVLELGIPVVVALNMVDLAESRGIRISAEMLAQRLACPVVPLVASKGVGIDALKSTLAETLTSNPVPFVSFSTTIRMAAAALVRELAPAGEPLEPYEVERALIDEGGYAETRLQQRFGAAAKSALARVRVELGTAGSLAALDARARYAWINQAVDAVETRGAARTTASDRIDRSVGHPVLGSLLFLLLMAAVFQSVFAWAAPLMDLIDGAAGATSDWIKTTLPPGAIASLLADGVVAGVGSVVVFLPQILILFAFIIFLEDSGYMARAAFLMDRLMRWCGLSGQSFIPMLSSFACAVPGIMGTRVIADPRDRLATILAAPFMTCSARLPVYALLISAFVPTRSYLGGLVNLQGLVLLGLYLLGIAGGVLTAFLLKRSLLRGPTPPFLMELPPYRVPNLKAVLYRMWERARMFLVRAGTIIFTVAIVVWALAYFPHWGSTTERFAAERAQAAQTLSGGELDAASADIDHREAATHLEESLLGHIGRAVAPVFHPLGWDWKISAAVLASFPAREVVIAVLGTIYAVGADVDAENPGLVARIRASQWPDGSRVFSLAVALGLMVFYAFCLQCAATVATIRRETNSWRWPAFAWVYMTLLGYLSAFIVYRLAS
ncbi:MAG: Fe(2+) transporter FeoB [Gammaproteobacteria bacterium]|nr:Fe(2+) transporter FeoB [Gammaproteobacteria bacterium]